MGDKVVSRGPLSETNTHDRKYEARCMDATGHPHIHVALADGSTGLLPGNEDRPIQA